MRSSTADRSAEVTVRSVTVIVGVVALIFLFGNAWALALHLGVPAWVAPLVAPATDLSIPGLPRGARHLARHGATPDQLSPRLLIFSSAVPWYLTSIGRGKSSTLSWTCA